jgi:hypothetical protein
VLLIGPLANGKPGEVGGGGRLARGKPSILASVVGVLVAFGAFGVLAIVASAVGFAIGGMPLDLAPGDWHGLATLIALCAATVSLLAYLFGGYVAARLGGSDGLQHGLSVFALAVVVIGVLGLLAVGMEGPASVGAGVREPAVVSAPGEGIRFGDVAVKATVWSLVAMLTGSAAGGVLGGRANRRRAEAVRVARDGRPSLPGK